MSGKSTGVLKVPKSFLNDRFIPLHTHTCQFRSFPTFQPPNGSQEQGKRREERLKHLAGSCCIPSVSPVVLAKTQQVKLCARSRQQIIQATLAIFVPHITSRSAYQFFFYTCCATYGPGRVKTTFCHALYANVSRPDIPLVSSVHFRHMANIITCSIAFHNNIIFLISHKWYEYTCKTFIKHTAAICSISVKKN